MNADFPDSRTLHAALTLTARAPWKRNLQPWHWHVTTHRLDLHANHDGNDAPADPDRRDLLLDCGAALHHCQVGLAALGWQSRVDRLPDPHQPEYVAALEVYPRAADELDIALAAAIPTRRTDHRPPSPWPVPFAALGILAARVARQGIMLRRVESLPALQDIVAQAITTQAAYDSPADDPAPAHGHSGTPTARTDPQDQRGVVLALGTVDDSLIARIRAGEATSLTLLSATAMGLASCAVTEPLRSEPTRSRVQSDVFGAAGYPQTLLRVGWPPINSDPLPPTPQRPLSDTVEWAEESS